MCGSRWTQLNPSIPSASSVHASIPVNHLYSDTALIDGAQGQIQCLIESISYEIYFTIIISNSELLEFSVTFGAVLYVFVFCYFVK